MGLTSVSAVTKWSWEVFLAWTGGDRVEPRRGRVEKVVICFPVEFSALVKFLFRLDPIRLGNSR